MKDAVVALLSSRKFFVGTITVLAVISAVVLRALDKIPADALVPTIVSLTAVALGVIGTIAWEDTASAQAASAEAIADTHAKIATAHLESAEHLAKEGAASAEKIARMHTSDKTAPASKDPAPGGTSGTP